MENEQPIALPVRIGLILRAGIEVLDSNDEQIACCQMRSDAQAICAALNRPSDGWVEIRSEEDLPKEKGEYLFTFAFHSKDGEQFGGRRLVQTLYIADGKWFSDEEDYDSNPSNGWSFDDSQYLAWKPLPAPFEAKK